MSVKKEFKTREGFETALSRDFENMIFPGGIGIRLIWTFVFGVPMAKGRMNKARLRELADEIYV